MSKPISRIYGYGQSSGQLTPAYTIDNLGRSSCMSCFDFREPSFNTVIYGDTRKGFLPAGSYQFTQEGTVIDLRTGFPMEKDALLARVEGPIVGATMGACVNRAVESKVLNYAGSFNPIPSSRSRGCYL